MEAARLRRRKAEEEAKSQRMKIQENLEEKIMKAVSTREEILALPAHRIKLMLWLGACYVSSFGKSMFPIFFLCSVRYL